MKNVKALLLILAASLVGLQVNAQDSAYDLDQTYSVEADGTIHLNSDDAEVEITGTDRSDVHLVVYRRVDVDGLKIKSEGEFRMDVENRNGNLYIRENSSESHQVIFGNIDEEYRITLEVPRTVSLSIQGDDDSYRIANVAGSIALKADDSDIELSGTGGDSFEFQIDDGSIQMEKGSGTLSLKMDDGDMYVRNASFSEVDAEMDDGEIDLTTTLADGGFYRFEMDDGDLELNIAGGGGEFDVRHDENPPSVGGSFEEISSDEERAVFRLPGGDARIEIDADDGDIDLRTI